MKASLPTTKSRLNEKGDETRFLFALIQNNFHLSFTKVTINTTHFVKLKIAELHILDVSRQNLVNIHSISKIL